MTAEKTGPLQPTGIFATEPPALSTEKTSRGGRGRRGALKWPDRKAARRSLPGTEAAQLLACRALPSQCSGRRRLWFDALSVAYELAAKF